MKTLALLFWISLFVVFYTYLGYGIMLYILVRIKESFKKPIVHQIFQEAFPEITLLIAAYNEENIVDEKMFNISAQNYPGDKLKIVWVTDGSTDNTNLRLSHYANTEVLFEPKRGGKTAAINRAMPYIKTDLIIFTDANTMLNKEAVQEIVKAFSDPNVGCVAGEKRIATKDKDNASSGGEGIYWRYESTLKALDSRLNTTVGAAGELFAIRRDLFEEMEVDTLLDDFILSMRIAQKGYKIEYCSNAYAIEEGSYSMSEEKKRKVRIAAGGIQSVCRLRALLNFLRYPMLSFQFISHRVLRWTITPPLLFALFPLNLCLVAAGGGAIYILLFIFQLGFYILAILGKQSEGKKIRNKFLFVPYYFLFMNINVFEGFVYLLKKKKGDGTWEKAKRA
ncbi:MAG: glycosyltransferase family 2 protein [Rikenellaceae bacterium]